jgi:hypothetical protein
MTVQAVLVAYLQADAAFMGYTTGGVWMWPIQRNLNPPGTRPSDGSTPAAFDDDPPYRIRRPVYVDGGTGPDDIRGPSRAAWCFPVIWFYCQPKESEKSQSDAAWQRAYDLIHDQSLVLNGNRLTFRVVNELSRRDSPDLSGATMRNMALQGSFIR